MAAFWESPLSPAQQQEQLLFAVCALTRGDRARYYAYDEQRNLTRSDDMLIDTTEPCTLPDRFDAAAAALLSPGAAPVQRATDTGQLLLIPVHGADGTAPKGVIAVEKVRSAGDGFSAMPDGTRDGCDITFSPPRLDMAATVLGAFSCFMFPQDRFLMQRAEERFAESAARADFYDTLAMPMLRYMAESDPREELAKHLRNVPELAGIVLRALDADTTGPFRDFTLGAAGIRLIESLSGVHDIGKMYHRRGEIPFLPELGDDAGFVTRNQAHPEFSLRILSFPVAAMRKDALLAADHHLDGRLPFGNMAAGDRLWLSQTIALSDMFEAITGPRAFRKEEFRNGYSVFNALEFLRDAATRSPAKDSFPLDPQLVRFFVEHRLYERYMANHPELQADGRLATEREQEKAGTASGAEALEKLRDTILRDIPLDLAHTPQGRLDYAHGVQRRFG